MVISIDPKKGISPRRTRHLVTLAIAVTLIAGCGTPASTVSPTVGAMAASGAAAGPFSAQSMNTQGLEPGQQVPDSAQRLAANGAPPDLDATFKLASTAPSASATASNMGFPATRAIDGDTNTEWSAWGAGAPALTLDMQGTSAISSINIKARPGQPFLVQVSTDGSNFQTVLNTSTASWSIEPKNLPTSTSGRYIRIKYQAVAANVMVFEVTATRGPVTLPSGSPTTGPAPSIAPTTPSVIPTTNPTPAPSGVIVAPAPTTAPATPLPAQAAIATGVIATRFGNQSVPRIGNGAPTVGYQLMTELGMNTIREGWNWKNIETGDHQYVSWMSYFDDKVNKFAAMNTKVQAMVCDTPAWASTDGTPGGVPKGLGQAIFADGTDVYKAGVGINPSNTFASYMFDMVSRYKGKIAYWQVWNEPDFPSADLGAGSVGSNGNSRFWHGSIQDYVRLLRVASTVARGVDPQARITLGGLGYENYLKAVLDNGGAPYFDVVDFHAYGTDKTSSNGVLNSAWGFLGRYNALKAVMTSHGVTGKTFSCSETGMTADNPGEQANYVAKVFATGLAQGDVEMVQWAVFTNPGFLNIGLIDQATLSVKNQGYTAFAIATRQLAGCTPLGALSGPGVQGYRFRRGNGTTLSVVWATQNGATLSLVAGSQVQDVQGRAQAASGTLTLTTSPVYVTGS